MTKLGMKRTIPQLPLKRKTALKSRTRLNRISKRQERRNANLTKIEPPLDGLCEKCRQKPDWRGLMKHHKIFRSHNGSDDRDNIQWLCGKCHSLKHGIIER